MTQSAIPAALVARDFLALRAAMVGELVPTIPNATDPVTYDPRELGVLGGNIFPAVVWQSKLWFRDGSDTTTLADELTCIVTLDGSRYKTDDIHMPWSVLSRELGTPPDPDDVVEADRPEYGQAWLVPDAATGEWATHEDEIVVWTSRGWVYKAPQVGHLVYVEDELGFIHYNAADEWEDGTGLYGLPDGSIRPNHLLVRAWFAENQTTTAPPATGPAGETYIIGASATGAWSSHDKKIAWRPSLNAAFVITPPIAGEEAYDKSLSLPVRWNTTSSSWVSAAGSIVGVSYAEAAANVASPTLVPPSSGATYSYSSGTGPTQTNYHHVVVSVVHTAKRAGAALLFDLRFQFTGDTLSSSYTVAVFRGAVNAAQDFFACATLQAGEIYVFNANLKATAPDNTEQTYKLIITRPSGAAITNIQRALVTVLEVA